MSTYVEARQVGDTAVRRALLDVASALLATEGPQALTMRRVATAASCSTTVLYTFFGGKAGLAEALFREGFARFAARLAAVPDDPDPLIRLAALRDAYRDNARSQRHYYGLMFGSAIPGFTPSPQALTEAGATLQVLTDAVRRCVDAGALQGDPDSITTVVWAAAHGAVSLELAGFFPDEPSARSCYQTLTEAAARAFAAPVDDSTDTIAGRKSS